MCTATGKGEWGPPRLPQPSSRNPGSRRRLLNIRTGQEVVSSQRSLKTPVAKHQGSQHPGQEACDLRYYVYRPFWNFLLSFQSFLYHSACLFREPIQALRTGYGLFLLCLGIVTAFWGIPDDRGVWLESRSQVVFCCEVQAGELGCLIYILHSCLQRLLWLCRAPSMCLERTELGPGRQRPRSNPGSAPSHLGGPEVLFESHFFFCGEKLGLVIFRCRVDVRFSNVWTKADGGTEEE